MTYIHLDGVDDFADALEELKLRASEAGEIFVRKGQAIIATKQKAEFVQGSGSPGWTAANFPHPTSYSGNLKSNLGTRVEVTKTAGSWTSVSGPTLIYARRIELGYHGIGVFPYFTTRPFPYFAPGLEKSRPALDALFSELMGSAQAV
jgi:hypothetical protein